MSQFYDFNVKTIDGEDMPLKAFEGKTVLVTNVASKCGMTPQYKGLEALYRKYKDKGFVVIGIPCNQFAGQEPGAESEIKSFCTTNYDVTFPMTGKIEVNGGKKAPLFQVILVGILKNSSSVKKGKSLSGSDPKWRLKMQISFLKLKKIYNKE
jgi:glutathione peroxidase